MSDSWAICPECGCFDAAFRQVDKNIDENDENQLMECFECGEVVQQKDILWKHVEYCKGQVIE